MRLIDADALIKDTKKRYCSGCYSYNGVRCRACWVDDMQGEIEDAPAVKAIPADVLRSLFIKRMTVDSETKDRRRKDYNQAIFGYRSDGGTFPCFEPMDMDMVLDCFDNACKDYFAGNIANKKKEG